nr:serine/threonine-protein kinase D6PKL2 [Ipomoea batatas]
MSFPIAGSVGLSVGILATKLLNRSSGITSADAESGSWQSISSRFTNGVSGTTSSHANAWFPRPSAAPDSSTISIADEADSFASHLLSPNSTDNPARDPCWIAIRALSSSSLSLSDLSVLKRLGAGDMGAVYLVKLRKPEPSVSSALFAAKVIDRKEIESRSKEGRLRTEREILEILDHPFVPTLYATIDSPNWSCLLMEFCPGGDLHVLRQRQHAKRFNELAVRFYASEVVAALEYIHMLGIVYRDLKPENVLVRSDGHIMLTDFDLSLKCDECSSTTATVVTGEIPPDASPESQDFCNNAPKLPNCMAPAVHVVRGDPRVLGAGDGLRRRPRQRRGLVDAGDLHFRAVLRRHAVQRSGPRAYVDQYCDPGAGVPEGARRARRREGSDIEVADQRSGESVGVHDGSHGGETQWVLPKRELGAVET